MNPLEARWAKEPVLTIDGGLATEMEARDVNIVSDADRSVNRHTRVVLARLASNTSTTMCLNQINFRYIYPHTYTYLRE